MHVNDSLPNIGSNCQREGKMELGAFIIASFYYVLVVVVVLLLAPGAQPWQMTAPSRHSRSSSSIPSTRCCDVLTISRNWRSSARTGRPFCNVLHLASSGSDDCISAATPPTTATIRLQDLMEMDVVVFSATNNNSSSKNDKGMLRQLGAVQEDGRVTPLCVWTLEPAFATSLEFLVDEHDLLPGYRSDDEIVIHSIVPQDKLSYGSRQVGGGMGPGNPHGEESELLYYIDQSIVDEECIQVVVKPELEIFW